MQNVLFEGHMTCVIPCYVNAYPNAEKTFEVLIAEKTTDYNDIAPTDRHSDCVYIGLHRSI